MRFMFGQALAGAARRGSQRLQELEQRAQTITDRATQRFLNQHDAWQTQYDADKREYTKAYESLNNVGIELTNAQKEMILLGGPEGAKAFAEAYKNDRENQAYKYSKQKGRQVGFEAGRTTELEKPQFKYTDEMKQAFLGKVFQRSDDYNKLVGQGDEKGLADLGLGIKKASALYAQGLNPYRDIEESMQMTAQTEEQKNQSMLGLTIPASYLQSGIRDQLAAIGVVKPEEIEGAELGVGTGWKTPSYDLVDTETLLRIEESAQNQEKVALSMKATIQEMEFNENYNPIIMSMKLKELSFMPEKQKSVVLDNINREIRNAYDKVVLDGDTAKTLKELEIESVKLDNDLKNKSLSETSVSMQIAKAHGLEIHLKQQLKTTTDPEKAKQLSAQIKSTQSILQEHLIFQKTQNSIDSGINNIAPLMDLKDKFFTDARRERGYFVQQTETSQLAQVEGEDQVTGTREGYTTPNGVIFKDTNPQLFKQIEDEIRADIDFKFLSMLATPDTEGNFVSNFPADDGINGFLMTLSVKNKQDYELALTQRITYDEQYAIADAIVDGVMTKEEIIKDVAQSNQIGEEHATKIVNNYYKMYAPEQTGGGEDATNIIQDAQSTINTALNPEQEKLNKYASSFNAETTDTKTLGEKIDDKIKQEIINERKRPKFLSNIAQGIGAGGKLRNTFNNFTKLEGVSDRINQMKDSSYLKPENKINQQNVNSAFQSLIQLKELFNNETNVSNEQINKFLKSDFRLLYNSLSEDQKGLLENIGN